MAEENQEFEIEYTSEAEYLDALCAVITTIEATDPLEEIGIRRKKRIIKRSVKIIDKIVDGLYKSYFEGDE